MKAASHPFWSRSKFGFHYEKLLKEKIESVIGEPIQKTSYSGDMMDFESKNYFIELKSRGDQYHFSQTFIKKDGWLLPYCKIDRARKEKSEGKICIFFYFWTAGRSLWKWDFNEEDLVGCKVEYPPWHQDGQRQIYIPEKCWIQV